MNENQSGGQENGEIEAPKFSVSDLKRKYYPPNELESAVAVMQQITDNVPSDKTTMNFDIKEDFPEGYGIGIIPISKRVAGGDGNVIVGVAIASIPDFVLVTEHEKGGAFTRDIVMDFFMAKIANAARPRQDGTAAVTLPKTIDDFLDRSKGRASLKAFTEFAADFVQVLRKMGLKLLTTSILRQLLQSAAFAKAQFPKIPQDRWKIILNAIIAKAAAKEYDTAVLVNWLETRDQAIAADVEDLDLSDLDALMAGEDTSDDNADDTPAGETPTESAPGNTPEQPMQPSA